MNEVQPFRLGQWVKTPDGEKAVVVHLFFHEIVGTPMARVAIGSTAVDHPVPALKPLTEAERIQKAGPSPLTDIDGLENIDASGTPNTCYHHLAAQAQLSVFTGRILLCRERQRQGLVAIRTIVDESMDGRAWRSGLRPTNERLLSWVNSLMGAEDDMTVLVGHIARLQEYLHRISCEHGEL